MSHEHARKHLDDHLLRVQRWLSRHRLLFVDRYGELPGGEGAEEGEALARLTQELAALEERARAREAEPGAEELPLLRLRRALGLSRHEEDLLVALCAAEVEPEFQRAYMRAFADQGSRQGDVAFFAELVGGRGPHRHALEGALHPGGALSRHGLITLAQDRGWAPRTPLLYLKVKLGTRLGSFLQGDLLPPPHTLPHAVSIYKGERLQDLVLPEDLTARVSAALAAQTREDALPVGLLGPRNSGRKALCAALFPDHPMVVVNLGALPKDPAEFEQVLREALCESVLQGGLLFLDNGAVLGGEMEEALKVRLSELLYGVKVRLVISSEGAVDPLLACFPRLLPVPVPIPDAITQTTLWARLLPSDVKLDSSCDLEALTLHYSLPAGSIHRCVADMARAARVKSAERPLVTMSEALAAVRRQLGNRFGDLAQLVSTTFRWDDLILPDEVLQRVLEVVAYARHRDLILYQWGFERKLPYGRSISVLLAGAPGTGKTMVASLLAKEMGLELFRVNVSRVVDKYIGETEKNLARIFEEARRGQVALLFDEADSLFGKRTEVRSSNDRYSNLAVNYLLQAVESHDGVIILTTNHEKAMDDAFRRRIRFRVSFPMPTEEDRARLWRSMIPPEAHLDSDVDWLALGRRFNMAGGAIKNAAVRAALHAASQGSAINADFLEHGARLESEELGCLVLAPTPTPTPEEG